MLVNSSNSASAAVTGAIQHTSQATGASFNYLVATAQVESGLNPQAGASTSSARGLFQFIERRPGLPPSSRRGRRLALAAMRTPSRKRLRQIAVAEIGFPPTR
jgi:hypothetical protein